MGRQELIDTLYELERERDTWARKSDARITELQAIGSRLVESRQTMRENIARHLAARGFANLATEVRAMRFENPPDDVGIVLPGWTCVCGGFTSTAKGADSAACRFCGKAKGDGV
jgi:hypothetical protein